MKSTRSAGKLLLILLLNALASQTRNALAGPSLSRSRITAGDDFNVSGEVGNAASLAKGLRSVSAGVMPLMVMSHRRSTYCLSKKDKEVGRRVDTARRSLSDAATVRTEAAKGEIDAMPSLAVR